MHYRHYSSDGFRAMQKVILDILNNVEKPITKKQLDRELKDIVNSSLDLLTHGYPAKVVRSRKNSRVFLSLQK